ncbi:MarR family transcriptional regulator [Actinotalea ferrariae]|uniref:MarR family winged helix-turn-helix transcriptional regulator n=1 Tax=Actinotalea ferrariae TaxID=1386098 RepID=UPI001C8B9220|nr:MarR family transcriptional regulator [Actinotalea ferrariae]MBX9245948.1 MarR family transcriptional regulator [Actinotalea ferrariae]
MSDGTRWLSRDELVAWMRLQAVIELLPGALDAQLRRDSDLTHYEYLLLAMLSEAPDRVLRMSHLASATNATLPRLSHVVTRLERDGYVRREPDPADRRATLARLTEEGWDKVVASAPGHVHEVRRLVVDALTPEQVTELSTIMLTLVRVLDPANRLYHLDD